MVFIFILIINIYLIFSFTLGKGDSIETDFDSILFDSKSFYIRNKIKFKFIASNYCENILYYGYYEDYYSAYKIYETPFYVLSSKEKNNNKILYFTIIKNSEELNGLDGKYILLKFNCNGTVEIINFNSKSYFLNIILTSIILLFIVIIIIIIIYCIYKRKYKNKNKNREYKEKDNKIKKCKDNDSNKDKNNDEIIIYQRYVKSSDNDTNNT